MDDALSRIAGAPVGVLATTRPDGRPHLVPMVFALVGDDVVSAIDWKPKTGRRLQRLANIEASPSVSFLVHHYTDDWSGLWWARVDGSATLYRDGPVWDEAIAALIEKYPQYQGRPPQGEVIWIKTETIAGWQA